MAYMEQLRRIERWLEKIKINNSNKEEYEDFLWAFFQNCYHLRDWIKNDPEVKDSKSIEEEVIRELEKKEILWLIQGLANRTKHFELKDSRQSQSLVAAHISVDISEAGSTTYSYAVYDENEKSWIPAIQLAENGIRAWENILHKFNLR